VAAFVYDKPGLGNSAGGNWLLLAVEDQATYVLSAVKYIESRPNIESVGVWGFSQGGWVAPLAASRSHDIAPLLAGYLAASPARDFTISVLPGANHQLMTNGNYHPFYFPLMTGWVAARFVGDAADSR
jgi:hypothetical protein